MDNINLNHAVFTTKHILKNKMPIIYAHHNSDNDWRFLPDCEVNVSDIMIVSLSEVIDYDATIIEILTYH